jgi:hypothetical protein
MPRVLLLFVACGGLAFPQSSGLPAKEKLTYNIEWRLITAGKATLDWGPSGSREHPGWQANLHLESVGLVSKLFRVEDDYTVNLNQSLCALSSVMTSHESTRRRETKVTYDAETHKASYQERDLNRNTVTTAPEVEIPDCVHDVVGGLYYLRTLNLEPGQSAEVAVSDGKKSVMAKVEAQRREDVKIRDTVYKTIRYELYLFNNVLYRRSAHLYIWVTDDERKLPVQLRVRLQIAIGTITLQLDKAE